MLASNSTVEAAAPALLVQLSACGGTAAWQDVRFRDLYQLLGRQPKEVEAKLQVGEVCGGCGSWDGRGKCYANPVRFVRT